MLPFHPTPRAIRALPLRADTHLDNMHLTLSSLIAQTLKPRTSWSSKRPLQIAVALTAAVGQDLVSGWDLAAAAPGGEEAKTDAE